MVLGLLIFYEVLQPSLPCFAVRSARVPAFRHPTLRALVMSDKGHAEPDVRLAMALVT